MLSGLGLPEDEDSLVSANALAEMLPDGLRNFDADSADFRTRVRNRQDQNKLRIGIVVTVATLLVAWLYVYLRYFAMA